MRRGWLMKTPAPSCPSPFHACLPPAPLTSSSCRQGLAPCHHTHRRRGRRRESADAERPLGGWRVQNRKAREGQADPTLSAPNTALLRELPKAPWSLCITASNSSLSLRIRTVQPFPLLCDFVSLGSLPGAWHRAWNVAGSQDTFARCLQGQRRTRPRK